MGWDGAGAPGGGTRRGGLDAASHSGAALIDIRSDAAVDQVRAFRMTLREKPTVLQPAPCNALICAYALHLIKLGTYRAHNTPEHDLGAKAKVRPSAFQAQSNSRSMSLDVA